MVLVNAEQEEKNAIDRLEQQHREIAESEAREREAKLLALRYQRCTPPFANDCLYHCRCLPFSCKPTRLPLPLPLPLLRLFLGCASSHICFSGIVGLSRKEEEKLRELEERQRELDEKVKMDLIRGQEEAQESDRQESDENENTPKPQERNIVKKRKVVVCAQSTMLAVSTFF